jgi:hypothetical protein
VADIPGRAARGAVAVIAIVIAATVFGAGVFLLVQRQTGPRASATVDRCVTRGTGRRAQTYCTGSWIVGGSLLAGGHVVVGTIQGAEQSDEGKTLDVTLRGDTAYSRGLALPLVLVALGSLLGAGTARFIATAFGKRNARRTGARKRKSPP